MSNLIKSASFVSSSAKLDQCPAATQPEFAFIGRSNVGKSSLINMLVGVKGLAKTSGTPGKTQLINHFIINEKWFLVDLPGYGFAKVSKTLREKWQKTLYNYLQNRKNLYCVFVLVDCRVSPQNSDLEMINWLGENQIPLCVIFTKTDKLKERELQSNLDDFKKALLQYWETLPPMINTSAEKGYGKDEVINFIYKYI